MKQILFSPAWGLLVFFGAFVAGCGKEPEPRTRDEIFRDRLGQPAVYLTHPSGKRIVGRPSQHAGIFVDPESGEVAWRALSCENPDCPGRSAAGEPFLFIAPDPTLVAKPDGTIGLDPSRATASTAHNGQCPQCLTKRTPASESEQLRRQYLNWVKPHVLPETAARLAELDKELARRAAIDRRRRLHNFPGESQVTPK